MSFSWIFKQATPGDRARESQVEKFFSSDAVANIANAIVREGIQNSLDAAPDDATVKVRIKVGLWSNDNARIQLPMFEQGFREHLAAEGVSTKLPNLPSKVDNFRYLTFEDFGTTGLQGNPSVWWPDEHGKSEPFFNYFRAEGISGKTEGARGRHGVGRLVFMFASRTRSMFGLTRRDGLNGKSEELLMGTTVLKNHWIKEIPYLPDGWFGIPDEKVKGLTLPIQDSNFIDIFKEAFGLSRTSENGLSVSVPWLHEDVTATEILHSTIAGYYYPILSKSLTVEISDENESVITIDANSIESIVDNCEPHFQESIRPMISLAKRSIEKSNLLLLKQHSPMEAPKWGVSIADEHALDQIHELLEAGELASIRVPIFIRKKDKPPEISFFDVHMSRDANISDSKIDFIREGIIITDIRPRRTSGIRALVVIEEGPLATFLGDSENPSHTQWQKDIVKDKYVYAPGRIDFITQSVPQILTLISQKQRRPETSLLIDLFSIPSDSGQAKPQTQHKDGIGQKTKKDKPNIKKENHSFSIEKRKDGFVVRKSGEKPFKPLSFIARAAYAVRRGDAFAKYEEADFIIGKGDVKLNFKNCKSQSVGPNWVIVRAESPEFELSVTGFDCEHRDVIALVKEIGTSLNEEASDAT